MIVVDANVLAFYLLEGTRTAAAKALRTVDDEWMVPAFWCVEMQSVLWKYARLGGMPESQAVTLLGQAIAMFSANEMTPAPEMVLREALERRITVYDAQYVALARQLGVLCVTEDIPLQKACPDIAVSLDAFMKGRQPGGAVCEEHAQYSAIVCAGRSDQRRSKRHFQPVHFGPPIKTRKPITREFITNAIRHGRP